MDTTSYKCKEAIRKRFIIHGPEGFLFHDAVKRYCDVLHPKIKKVSTIPFWLAAMIALVSNQPKMKEVSDFMASFEKNGERGDPSEANHILGAPGIKLENWLQKNK